MEGNKETEIEVIHSWSAPRSLSTSVMYSFAQVYIHTLVFLTARRKSLIEVVARLIEVWKQQIIKDGKSKLRLRPTICKTPNWDKAHMIGRVPKPKMSVKNSDHYN